MAGSVNGVTFAALGYRIARRQGDLTPAIGAPPTIAVPGRRGVRLTGAGAPGEPRTITLTGTLAAASAHALRSALDTLLLTCQGAADDGTSGPVTLVLEVEGGTSGRQWTAYLAGQSAAQRRAPTALSPVADVTLVWLCPDPCAVDSAATTLALSTAIVRTPVGTAPAWPVLRLDGPIANGASRQVSVRSGDNTVVGSLQVTAAVSLATGEWIEIDTDAQTITQVTGGGVTRTSRPSWLTDGDWLALDPRHIVNGVSPALALSSGTGTVTYRRAWR